MSAALLLAVLLLPLLALGASLGPVDDTATHVCCRAHGKHHCSGERITEGDSRGERSLAASTVSERCPFQGVVSPIGIRTDYGSPSVFSQDSAYFNASPVRAQQKFYTVYESFQDCRKRGPPDSIDISHEA
jgi:hypothetical protein